MKSKQFCLIFVAWPLFLLLREEPVNAFSLIGDRSGERLTYQLPNDFSSDYPLKNGWPFPGTGEVLTYSLEELVPPDDTDSSNDFISILKTYFPAWTFTKSNKELQGNFKAKNYYVCAPYSECGISPSHPNPGLKIQKNGVGAFFDLQYEAAHDDPSLAAGNSLHWIQVVKSQAQQAGVPASPPIVSTFVDPPNPTPFYDFYYNQFLNSPNRDHFIDRPYRGEPDINNIFLAELYLAEVKNPLNKPQEVTIYNGVKWGWQNTFTPQPPSGGGGGGCTGGSGSGGCDNFNDNYSMNNQNIGTLNSEFASSFFNDNSAHQQETKNSSVAETVPEPTGLLGTFLGLGMLGLFKKLRNQKNFKP